MTVDITCAVSDDARIAASKKECMLYFVEVSPDGTTRKTNGPERTVASKTTDSVVMIRCHILLPKRQKKWGVTVLVFEIRPACQYGAFLEA